MLKPYDAGRYAILHTRFSRMWPELNDPCVIARMKMLSRRGVPAVAALDIDAEIIWQELRNAAAMGFADRVKQMIGHQVRQIMTREGYRKTSVKPLPTSWIFASGAVYRLDAWRTVYLHRNRDVDSEHPYCVTNRRRLPSSLYPEQWVFYRQCSMQHELEFALNEELSEYDWSWTNLCDEVQDNGFTILG